MTHLIDTNTFAQRISTHARVVIIKSKFDAVTAKMRNVVMELSYQQISVHKSVEVTYLYVLYRNRKAPHYVIACGDMYTGQPGAINTK